MSTSNRRRLNRIELRLPVILRRRSPSGEVVVLNGLTQNVSAEGFYLEARGEGIQLGDELELEMTLPPGDGVSPFEGHATAMAEVTRVDAIGSADGEACLGIAGRFRHPLKLRY